MCLFSDIDSFQLPPALAGAIGSQFAFGFSQKSLLFWLKPIKARHTMFLQLKLKAIKALDLKQLKYK